MSELTRAAFSDEISELENNVLWMGSVVESMLHKSIEALVNRSDAIAQEVIDLDDVVDNHNLSIENQCLKLIAKQQPMARDLRTIAAALKIITDIERMGDYVVDIAKTVIDLNAIPPFQPNLDIPHYADLVKTMLREALEAFVNRDLKLVHRMIEHDQEVDRLNDALINTLVHCIQQDRTITASAMGLVTICRCLERFADHVTNVGERIYYMETGELKELHK